MNSSTQTANVNARQSFTGAMLVGISEARAERAVQARRLATAKILYRLVRDLKKHHKKDVNEVPEAFLALGLAKMLEEIAESHLEPSAIEAASATIPRLVKGFFKDAISAVESA